MLIIFFDIKGIVHKESILAGQTVNSVYYCVIYSDCINLATKQLAVALQHIVSHFLFHQGFFFIKNSMTDIPHPTYFSLFPRLKIKLKGCHFNTIEMIEAESQAVLNTLTTCLPGCIRTEED
jgi:hypothetical protein